MNLAEWLKLSRERAGLTLEQIGDVVSRSKGAISQWENGKTEPSYWQVLAIYERTNRAVDLPPLASAPVEVGLSISDEWLNKLSPSARSLIDAVAEADQRNVSLAALDAIATLLKSIPGGESGDGERLRL
ncbi:helix-turn-helix domain-containing protein [Burkholderia pseudomallei]|uniref:helix-turn-helix transcriptional regulator n=1 Tax=Burkholderia pseudomallei TaxID=28450 RepID=UPI002DBCF74D|nr:helix-turn-helix domain-containing protein [Burkholderia pseudomallei]MEB5483945.1 helix-turn-helix domain-containing protein [Burkholderia pseudomallei]MEB5490800.1 helix-turn-helix domain-containing protein [Burkholderia pseudomallei]MEB5497496.1 helix-turn-helix domain-containing protein [Burkholderia pseudomallei]MEB5502773.1 helix-turn-helix domain-containing protein [Burkholderia pseudomallei]MEB5510154.1 helix-turn-helix domain-containing protein [Burkholderia pseudomallei]